MNHHLEHLPDMSGFCGTYPPLMHPWERWLICYGNKMSERRAFNARYDFL